METPSIELYLGTVQEVVNRETYEITADIPGVAQGVRAYPYSRGEMDEPVSGNLVYLLSVDPVYHSFYLYTKAKENGFVGIRSNGKLINISKDEIRIGVYDTEKTSQDQEIPETDKSYIKMDSSGNINIMASGDESIKISGKADVEVSGDVSVKISGNANIDVSGSVTLKSPDTTITGGKLTTKGQANTDMTGPYNPIKTCPFTGAPHCGSIVTGT